VVPFPSKDCADVNAWDASRPTRCRADGDPTITGICDADSELRVAFVVMGRVGTHVGMQMVSCVQERLLQPAAASAAVLRDGISVSSG
jgi:hypothetical protein